MSVCRGRNSEGIDFKDELARCVMIIGIPYPNPSDEKVILKMESLDKSLKEKNKLKNKTPGHIDTRQAISGKEWYKQ